MFRMPLHKTVPRGTLVVNLLARADRCLLQNRCALNPSFGWKVDLAIAQYMKGALASPRPARMVSYEPSSATRARRPLELLRGLFETLLSANSSTVDEPTYGDNDDGGDDDLQAYAELRPTETTGIRPASDRSDQRDDSSDSDEDPGEGYNGEPHGFSDDVDVDVNDELAATAGSDATEQRSGSSNVVAAAAVPLVAASTRDASLLVSRVHGSATANVHGLAPLPFAYFVTSHEYARLSLFDDNHDDDDEDIRSRDEPDGTNRDTEKRTPTELDLSPERIRPEHAVMLLVWAGMLRAALVASGEEALLGDDEFEIGFRIPCPADDPRFERGVQADESEYRRALKPDVDVVATHVLVDGRHHFALNPLYVQPDVVSKQHSYRYLPLEPGYRREAALASLFKTACHELAHALCHDDALEHGTAFVTRLTTLEANSELFRCNGRREPPCSRREFLDRLADAATVVVLGDRDAQRRSKRTARRDNES